MNPLFLAYILALPLFVVIDMVWLLGPGRPLYVAEIGSLLRASPNMPAAVAFYVLYVLGLVFFAIMGAVNNNNSVQALAYGAFFGLIAYATYDLTSLAVLNGFTLKIAVIDMIWGSILSGIVAWITARAVLALT